MFITILGEGVSINITAKIKIETYVHNYDEKLHNMVDKIKCINHQR